MEFTDYDTRLAAYAAIIDKTDRILLTWFNGSGHSAPGWTMPGGGVEFEESPQDAVVREVMEEASGRLGTTEVNGSTDFAEWMPIVDVPGLESRADIIDVTLAALNRVG